MAFGNTNYKDLDSGNLLAEGEYEVQIIKAGYTAPDGKTPHFLVEYLIRTDVEQRYGNKHLWDRLYKNKETGEYSNRWQSICKCAGVPEGTPVNNEADLSNAIILKAIRVVIKHQKNDYRGGELEAKIAYYKPSKYPIEIGNLSNEGIPGFSPVVDDGDSLPF